MADEVLTPDERRRIWLYFLNPRMGLGLGVLVLGLILVTTPPGKALLVIGLLWLGGAFVLGTKRPMEKEIDQMFKRDLAALTRKAVHSLGSQEPGIRAAPLALSAPVDLGAATNQRVLRPQVGRDGRRRSPVNQAVVLLPMEDYLGIYSGRIDSLTGLFSQISAEEHHYRDVVTVRLEADVEASAGGGRRTEAGAQHPIQVFSLELANGRRLSIPVAIAWQEEPAGEEGPLPTDLEKTVTAIRALLRDKR